MRRSFYWIWSQVNKVPFFSTTNPDATVESLCFKESSDFLLISTQYQCCEYNLSTDTLYHIKEAGENERFAGSNYNGKSIEIVVTQHMEAILILFNDLWFKLIFPVSWDINLHIAVTGVQGLLGMAISGIIRFLIPIIILEISQFLIHFLV